MILWERRGRDLWLFKDGEHIGTIPHDTLPALLVKIAETLKDG